MSTSIWLQRLASIRPRTSLPKFQAGGEFHLGFHIWTPPLHIAPTCPAIDRLRSARCIAMTPETTTPVLHLECSLNSAILTCKIFFSRACSRLYQHRLFLLSMSGRLVLLLRFCHLWGFGFWLCDVFAFLNIQSSRNILLI